MSSVSASYGNAAYYASQRNLFSKLDTDADGKLSKDEFVAGKPAEAGGQVGGGQIASLSSIMEMGATDTSGDGTSDSSSDSGRPGAGMISLLSADAMAVLMLMSPQGGMGQGGMSQGGDFGTGPSLSGLYAEMDEDGDGVVSQAEFVSARPDDVSEEEASDFFATMDTEGTGSITEEQFTEAMSQAGGPSHGGAPSGGADDAEETFDALDVNKDGVVSREEFVAGHPEDVSTDDAGALFDSLDTEGAGSITLEQFAGLGSGGSENDVSGSLPANLAKGIQDLMALLESMSSQDEVADTAA